MTEPSQSGFLHFFAPSPGAPQTGGVFPDAVEAALRDTVASGGVATKRSLCGEGGLNAEGAAANVWGVLGCRAEQDSLELLLDPGRQTWRVWRRFLDGETELGTLWVGYWTDRRPGPPDLARPKLWPTTEVARLGDGRDWLLPVLRFWAGEWLGPSRYTYSDAGEWIEEMEPRYAPLAERGERLYRTVMAIPDDIWDASDADTKALFPKRSDVADAMTRLEVAELIAAALSLNYCVSSPEVALLDLLSDATLETAWSALLGTETATRFLTELKQKKKQEAPGGVGTGSCGGGV